MYRDKDTPMNAPPKYFQTSFENGDRNENSFGGNFVGFLYKILIPKTHEEEYIIKKKHIFNTVLHLNS